MADYQFHIMDVFTQVNFTGNQLAVVLGADDIADDRMQKIAREFNFPETTFVRTPKDAGHTAEVRIFTPAKEIPFAGHPTIGTAIVLAHRQPGGRADVDITLEEQLGLVPAVVRTGPDGSGYASFTAPATPDAPRDAPAVDVIADMLSIDRAAIGFDNHAPQFVKAGNDWLFVPLSTKEAVGQATVDMAHWTATKAGQDIVGVYVYCRGGVEDGAAFHARMFAPEFGVPEDPATGSAAAAFPGQIIPSEDPGDGTHTWRVEQGYEMGRPSQIDLAADVAGGHITAVRVAGHAVQTATGTLSV